MDDFYIATAWIPIPITVDWGAAQKKIIETRWGPNGSEIPHAAKHGDLGNEILAFAHSGERSNDDIERFLNTYLFDALAVVKEGFEEGRPDMNTTVVDGNLVVISGMSDIDNPPAFFKAINVLNEVEALDAAGFYKTLPSSAAQRATSAVSEIAELLPTEDMWQSAAGTLECIDQILDRHKISRPKHYSPDIDIR